MPLSWNPPQRDAPPLQPSFIHLSKSPAYEPPAHGERFPHPETFLTYRPWSPVKELPPRPPPRSLFRERRPIPEPPSSISQSPRQTSPPSGSPNGAPMKRHARLQSLFYISFRAPSKGALPSDSVHRAPTERDTPPPEPFSTISQNPR